MLVTLADVPAEGAEWVAGSRNMFIPNERDSSYTGNVFGRVNWLVLSSRRRLQDVFHV